MTNERQAGRYKGQEFIALAPSIWSTPSLPTHWIIETTDHRLVMAPAVHNGWARRKDYHGHTTGLERLAPATAYVIEADLGAGFDLMRMFDQDWIAARYMDDVIGCVSEVEREEEGRG